METVRLRQACCLIVDDEPPVTEALCFVLHRAGWATAVAASGAEALSRLSRDACDVIVLDLGLPDADGIDLLRQIRARPATARTPIIVMTAGGARSARQAALDAGATLFVAKPFSVAAMVDTIQSANAIATAARGAS